MTKYMLDTDICSYLIRRQSPKLLQKLSSILPSQVCLSVITRAELLYGLEKLSSTHRLRVDVTHFLREMRVLPWDDEAAGYYARIRHQLTSSGQPIGELDMMIAAHSLSAGAVLVTNNTRHYERITQPLSLENWKI